MTDARSNSAQEPSPRTSSSTWLERASSNTLDVAPPPSSPTSTAITRHQPQPRPMASRNRVPPPDREKFRELRIKSLLTEKEVARRAHCSLRTVERIEAGKAGAISPRIEAGLAA